MPVMSKLAVLSSAMFSTANAACTAAVFSDCTQDPQVKVDLAASSAMKASDAPTTAITGITMAGDEGDNCILVFNKHAVTPPTEPSGLELMFLTQKTTEAETTYACGDGDTNSDAYGTIYMGDYMLRDGCVKDGDACDAGHSCQDKDLAPCSVTELGSCACLPQCIASYQTCTSGAAAGAVTLITTSDNEGDVDIEDNANVAITSDSCDISAGGEVVYTDVFPCSVTDGTNFKMKPAVEAATMKAVTLTVTATITAAWEDTFTDAALCTAMGASVKTLLIDDSFGSGATVACTGVFADSTWTGTFAIAECTAVTKATFDGALTEAAIKTIITEYVEPKAADSSDLDAAQVTDVKVAIVAATTEEEAECSTLADSDACLVSERETPCAWDADADTPACKDAAADGAEEAEATAEEACDTLTKEDTCIKTGRTALCEWDASDDGACQDQKACKTLTTSKTCIVETRTTLCEWDTSGDDAECKDKVDDAEENVVRAVLTMVSTELGEKTFMENVKKMTDNMCTTFKAEVDGCSACEYIPDEADARRRLADADAKNIVLTFDLTGDAKVTVAKVKETTTADDFLVAVKTGLKTVVDAESIEGFDVEELTGITATATKVEKAADDKTDSTDLAAAEGKHIVMVSSLMAMVATSLMA